MMDGYCKVEDTWIPYENWTIQKDVGSLGKGICTCPNGHSDDMFWMKWNVKGRENLDAAFSKLEGREFRNGRFVK